MAKAADLAANVGLAVLVNQLNKASDAAQKLADKAIEAGDIQEATAKAGEAVAKKQQAQSQFQKDILQTWHQFLESVGHL